MAKLNSKGLVDDGKQSLNVGGNVIVGGTTTFNGSTVLSGTTTFVGETTLSGTTFLGPTVFSGSTSIVDGIAAITGTSFIDSNFSGSMNIASTATITGSLIFNLPAVNTVSTDSDNPSLTSINVSGKYVVQLSGSAPTSSGSGGFNIIGDLDGQACLFMNVAAQDLMIFGMADGSYPVIRTGQMMFVVSNGSSWYQMSGSL